MRLPLLGFIFYCLGIATISLLPGGDLATPGVLDKIGHAAAYAVMVFWGLTIVKSSSGSIGIIFFCLAYGILLEYLQRLASGRDPSIADAAANIIGIGLGIGVYLLKKRFINRPA
jgi:VanZ family protein